MVSIESVGQKKPVEYSSEGLERVVRDAAASQEESTRGHAIAEAALATGVIGVFKAGRML